MSTQINPIWITVDEGEIFEGHQLHWANCYFSNATRADIEGALKDPDFLSNFCGLESTLFCSVPYSIQPMTVEQLACYPEAKEFCNWLLRKYGEY